MKQVSDPGAGMNGRLGKRISRRELLQGSLTAGGTLLLGFDKVAWSEPLQDAAGDLAASGRHLGLVGFSQEAPGPMETALGEGLDGRMYTDLSRLTPQTAVTT